MSEPQRIHDPRELDPSVLPLFAAWHRNVAARGIAVLIYETRRTPERQDWLYASGRTRTGPIVTHAKAGQSKHQTGRAWDCVPWEASRIGTPKSKLDWTPWPDEASENRWLKSGDLFHLDTGWAVMVREAEALGIEWAGRWTSFIEYAHFQTREV